jgi:hypothetical protein
MNKLGKKFIVFLAVVGLIGSGVPANAFGWGKEIDSLPTGDFVRATWSAVEGYPFNAASATYEIAFPSSVKCSYPTFNAVGECKGNFYSRWVSGSKLALNPNFYLYTGMDPDKAVSFRLSGAPSSPSWYEQSFTFWVSQSVTGTLRGDNQFGQPSWMSPSTSHVVTFAPQTIPITVQTKAETERDILLAKKVLADQLRAVKLTISCKKGSKTIRVTGDPPKCPSGSTALLGKNKAFQAYSTCKLYKKRTGDSRAELIDGGRTLSINSYQALWNEPELELSVENMDCLLRIMKVPSSVIRRINGTRPIDGYIEIKYPGGLIGYSIDLEGSLNATFTG